MTAGDPHPIETALRERIEALEGREGALQAKVSMLVDLLRQRGIELDHERRVRAKAECDRDANRDTLVLTMAVDA